MLLISIISYTRKRILLFIDFVISKIWVIGNKNNLRRGIETKCEFQLFKYEK